jgi:hypothetical protein
MTCVINLPKYFSNWQGSVFQPRQVLLDLMTNRGSPVKFGNKYRSGKVLLWSVILVVLLIILTKLNIIIVSINVILLAIDKSELKSPKITILSYYPYCMI